MNREIKFRAWSKSTGIVNIDDNSSIVLMFNKISGWNIIPNKPEYKGEYLLGESQSKTPDFVLMQFTGLHDKNGKEIYEGDVLKRVLIYEDGSKPDVHLGVVSWNDCEFYSHSIKNELSRGLCNKPDCVSFEVIGNIYENPELLKNL